MQLTRSEIISLFALCLSVTSVSFSIYFGLRDRGRLQAKSRFMQGWEGQPAHILLTIVNTGRRPIILRLWAGVDDGGEWIGTPFGTEKELHGLRLGEHESYQFVLERKDILATGADDEDLIFRDLWVEDSLGKRHPVRQARENLVRLWAI